jgi:hypothetical protein
MSEQTSKQDLARYAYTIPSKPFPAPRGYVVYAGTPEYEASLEARAPQIAANEAARIARVAQIAANDERRAEIRAEIDRIKAELDKWSEEHEPHYQTMEAARLAQLRDKKTFARALSSYKKGRLTPAALHRIALAHQATTDSYNALLPAYNARVEHNAKLWRDRLETEKLLYSIKP